MAKLFQYIVIAFILLTTLFLATVPTKAELQINSKKYQQHQQHHRQHHHHHAKHYHPHQRQHRRIANNNESETTTQRFDGEIDRVAKTHHTSNILGVPPQPRNASSTTTHLRRLTAREHYTSRVGQRRLNSHRNVGDHSEWAYHTYNIHTNTYDAPSHSPGKGDDNTDDVEFISPFGGGGGSISKRPDWSVGTNNRRSFGYVPPLVPTSSTATTTTTTTPRTTITPPTRRSIITTLPPPSQRRAYATAAPPSYGNDSDMSTHVTEDPFETNLISRNYPTEPKEMERRHICVQQRTITMPVKTTEVYTRPTWKHISIPCQMQTHPNQMCTRVQLVHEQAFRDVIRHKAAQQVTYDCCNGWMRETPHADACMKPACTTRCLNGGTCSSPDSCTCPPGFSGNYCEHDINECKEEKPCDQTCINTVGSFYCKCRDGFVLQSDQQSCKKIDLHDDDAFEARDLENEIETGVDVSDRLQKIERTLANERIQTNELHKTLQATYSVVDTLKSRLNTLEKQQQDLNRLQTNLYATESRTNKLEGMVNLLMKCRNGPNAYCP